MPAVATPAFLGAPRASAPARRFRAASSAPRASRAFAVRAAADEDESVQLGTAKLPETIDLDTFSRAMFQWANTLTTSGQNMPFALPQRVDALPTGFSMAFLQSGAEPGTFESVGEIVAVVEDVPGGGKALMVRGTGKVAQRGALVDVPQVMQTMPAAINNAILGSTPGL